MSAATVRWNLVVSKKIDTGLRQFLASRGGGKKGDLSRFVEEAVKKHIFETTLRAVHEKNANVSQEEIDAAVEESLAWARARQR